MLSDRLSPRAKRAVRAAIEPLETRRLLAVITVTSTADTVAADGVVTLREAITSANGDANINADVVGVGAYGTDTINFAIPGAGVQTISPTTPLPNITGAITINGYSQSGASVNTLAVGDNAVILIELRGTNVPAGQNGLNLQASNCTVRGLAIGGFTAVNNIDDPGAAGGQGIASDGAFTNITIAGNFLGTDAAGLVAVSNQNDIYLVASSGTIGGTSPADRNLISSAKSNGILCGGNHNVIQGNYFGVSRNSAVLNNVDSSIILTGSNAFSNQVGGNSAAARNVIVGGGYGISVGFSAHNNTIQGNYIGLNTSGTAVLGSLNNGILVSQTNNNLIGGAGAGEGNVIGGALFGIVLERALDDAIVLDSTGNLIRGKYIGVTPGNVSISNGVGVRFAGTTNNTLGGTGAGEGNVIAGNIGQAVMVGARSESGGANLTSAAGNQIVGNSIYNNGGLGIDLLDGPLQDQSGVTPDDVGDADTGSNNLQNKPHITATDYAAGHLTVTGDFQGSGAGTLFLDLYLSDTPDPSGFGEGKTYLGRFNVANGVGVVNFGPIDLAGTFVEGQIITGTLTDANGNTSEFSNAKDVTDDTLDPFCVRNTNDSGAGSLRQAILNANAHPNVGGDPDVICFEIPGSGVHTISPLTPLPAITDPAIVDGYVHQTGASPNTLATGDNAKILIELSGALLTVGSDGLRIDADNSIVRGLIINSFFIVGTVGGSGIHILPGHTNDTIEGNFIGTNSDATSFPLGQTNGVFIDQAFGNTVGGLTPAQRNIISGNSVGVEVSGTGATGNLVEGNYIGTNPAGTDKLVFVIGDFSISQATGVEFQTSGNTLGGTSTAARNLISGNSYGVKLSNAGTSGSQVLGNYIGTNIAGTGAVANGTGIYITGGTHTIGGTIAGSRNLISGNNDGIYIYSGPGGNIIQGNFIGSDLTGNAKLPNSTGIDIVTSPNNQIGGTTTAARNLISGNTQEIRIDSAGSINNTIQGNYIGTNLAGTQNLGNVLGGYGVVAVSTGAVIIGGTAPGAGNVIAGHLNANITMFSAPGTIIQGNFIGTNATGTAGLGGNGVFLNDCANVLVGGATAAARNIISGNSGSGVVMYDPNASGSKIQGNYIGTDVTGKLPIPNGDLADPANFGEGGVAVSFTSNITIGGKNPGEGNLIAFNTGTGIVVAATATGVVIEGNSVFSNTRIGIDINDDGVTSARDVGDPDTGANGTLNIPVIASAIADAFQTKIHVQLSNKANTTYRVEFFSNTTADGSGFGEGETYLGFADILTDGSGAADTTITLPIGIPLGKFISANVTSAEGTSEFSADVQASAGTPPPTLSINDVTKNEGDSGTVSFTFTVTRSGVDLTGTTTVDFTSANGTATVADSDYQSNSDTLTFAANETIKSVTITVNGDTKFEGNETFFVNLSDAVGGTIQDGQGLGTISNDDALPTLSINDVTKLEGLNGTTSFTFTVTRSGDLSGTSSVNFATSDGTATTADSDYTAKSGTVTFAATEATKTITINVTGDSKIESDEKFTVTLSQPSGATISGTGIGTGTISNDDVALPTFSINDVSLNEGNVGQSGFVFTVTRGGDLSGTSSVSFTTTNGTATVADGDYLTKSGVLTFGPNEQTKTVAVSVNGDGKFELDETFTVDLSSPTNATITDNQGLGTIKNDDVAPPLPTISINDVTLNEGNGGTTSFTFTVTRSGDTSGTSTVDFAVANGTATIADSDYQALPSGKITFSPQDTTKVITVTVNGDIKVESDETFFVNLTNATGATISDNQGAGTIKNDDVALPDFSINDVTLNEGNSGTTSFTFTITRTGDKSGTSTVNFAVADGTATTADSDYALVSSGTLTFGANEATKTITVTVNGDLAVESNETFFVNLTDPVGATISDAQGKGTITNDDQTPPPPPTISINDVSLNEGNSETTSFVFTVTRSGDLSGTTTAAFTVSDGTATDADSDYQPLSGTVTFGQNESIKTITVLVNGDTKVELDETFTVNLRDAVNGTISDGSGLGTIKNDDAIVQPPTETTLAINDVKHAEGNCGTTCFTFTITRSGDTSKTTTVKYQTIDGTAKAGSDYRCASGSLCFKPGEKTKTVTISVMGDQCVELDETFKVLLKEAANATIIDDSGVGTIQNDDLPPAPKISICDVRQKEGNSGLCAMVFTIKLDKPCDKAVTLNYKTADGTAKSGCDYQAASGSITFNPGETCKTITVYIIGNRTKQVDKCFSLCLSNSVNAQFGNNSAKGTIINDD